MKPTKLLYLISVVMLCALGAAAADDDARKTIARLEQSREAGTATRAEQLDLARAYIEVGRYYEAKKLAEAIADADATDTEAAQVRDRAAEQLRLIAEQRLADAEEAAKREGATDADRLELAHAYFSAGRYREATDLYAKLPDSVMNREARTRHARALTWSGHHAAAEVKYSALLAEESTPELELEYGRMLSWMGAERASISRLEKAHGVLNTEDSVTALANARAWSGDREGAIVLLDEYTAANPNAREAAMLLSQFRTSPDIRIERIDKLIGLDPFNLALRMERARMLYEAGRYGETMRTIRFIQENARQEIAGLSDLERRTEERRAEELAALDAKRRTMLGDPPMYSSSAASEQYLDLAKAYTSLGGYDQAIDLYDAYLDSVPDDQEARLNYARVLSWDRRYDASQRQYELILKTAPDRPDIQLEYAQTLTYDRKYVPAVRTLRTLTDVSDSPRAYLYDDVPPQAHYRLGQIYRWFGWRDTAVEQQNRALMLDSGLTDAHRELTRARYTMPGSRLEARYTDEVNSNDFHTRRGDLTMEHWLNPRLAVNGGVGRHHFEQRGLEADANVANIGAAYRQHDRLTFRGNVGMTFWESGNLGTRPYFGLGAVYLPNLQSRAAIDYNHYDLIYDVSNMFTLTPRSVEPSLNDPLSIDDVRAHYDWNSGGFWSALADASYGRISDDNSRQSLHGLLSFRVLKAPFVAIKADGRMLSYDRRSNRYWSPDDYRSLAGVLQVGQDIADRVFWTAELKVGKSWDGDRSSDLRAWAARVTVPVGEAFDIIGSYNYGRSGRFESLIGDPEFATYWQRSFYVGVRIKRRRASDDREAQDRYYFDNRVLAGSDAVPPEVR